MSTRARIGLIGAGGVAARHARALSGFADVHIVGVTDIDRQRARDLAASCSAPAYGSIDELLGAGVDAAYLCVPPFAHGEPERALVAAGVPFFVEKPLAVDVASAEAIAAAVAECGLVTATGYHWRYYDTVARARALLAERPARLATAYWLDKVPPVAWWQHRDRSGGPLVEQATHVLDLLRVLVGEVESVHAVGFRWDAGSDPRGGDGDVDGDVDQVSAATLRFAGGAVGSLASTSVLTWKHRAGVEIYADGLVLTLGEDGLVVDRGGEPERHAARVDAKTAGDRAFVDAVRSGDPSGVLVPYAEALRTHRLACAIATAALDRRTVDLSGELTRDVTAPALSGGG